jgi:RNA polymerase sigma factor (sigma-70 family)
MTRVGETERDDRELVGAARKGDQSAWDGLVHRHGGRVWAVARAHRLSSADAEDVFQVTFLRLVTHLDTIRQPERVGAWLATTARHECLRVLRRAGRAVPAGGDDALDTADVLAPSLDAALLAAERDEALLAAVERLSDNCRRLLRVLMADPEPTYEEVSLALGMPVGSIGPTRGRCLKHLRREIAGITAPDEGSQPA